MAIDALSIAAIIVSLVVAIAVFWISTRFGRELERKLRRLARQQALLLDNVEARELCRMVREQYPEACAGLDFMIEMDDTGRPRLAAWHLDAPKPDPAAPSKRRK